MNTRRLLLVEDSEDDELLTTRAFAKSGFENPIDVVRDGVEALDYLFARGAHADRDPAEMPAVVLLDIKMPKLSGLEVLAQMRAEPPTALLPVVFLTGSPQLSDVRRAYELGANAYMQKPVEYADFVEAVRHLGTFWLGLNVRPEA